MNPGVIFRKYEASDLPALKEIFFSNVPLYFNAQEWADYESFFKDDLPGHGSYDILLQNGEAIGAGGIALNEDGTVSLCWGMVHADLHKQGFGKKLLEYRLEQARHLHPGRTIISDTSQHSSGFFEKYGFETVRIEENFWAAGLHLYKMEKRS